MATGYEPLEELGEDIAGELDDIEEKLGAKQAAFAEITERTEAGLAACDEALERIQAALTAYDRAKQTVEAVAAAEAVKAAFGDKAGEILASEGEPAEQAEPASRFDGNGPDIVERALPNREAIERDAYVRERLREAGRSAANASWQLLLGFGLSFCVRVGVIGIWLGSWLDRRFLGGTGLGAAGIILLVIGYSFYMLYADLRRSDERWRKEKARLQAEAEAEWQRRR